MELRIGKEKEREKKEKKIQVSVRLPDETFLKTGKKAVMLLTLISMGIKTVAYWQ